MIWLNIFIEHNTWRPAINAMHFMGPVGSNRVLPARCAFLSRRRLSFHRSLRCYGRRPF